jgi:DNA-binding transcriptional regulator YhcF (GntR family)
MRLRIDRSSDIPICAQIAEQIAFLIATGKLNPGDALPSVRALALRHKIHRGTVSEAYQDLVERLWITRHRGRKMVVRAPHEALAPRREELDDLIDATIRAANERGYTLQQLRAHVRRRLLVEPADHVLIVEQEPGLRRLLEQELSGMLNVGVEAISPTTLAENPGRVIGALVVGLPGRMPGLVTLLPRGRPLMRLEPSGLDEHTGRIRLLKKSSVIGIVSVSQELLRSARGLFAPFVGSFHSMEEYFLEPEEKKDLSGLDLVFCDTLASSQIKARQKIVYRLLCDSTAKDISTRIAAGRD